jgi:hypothetical protein
LIRHELENEYLREIFFDNTHLASALATGELTIDKTVAERLDRVAPTNVSAAAIGR